jgi:hypothetical protein
MVVQQRKTAAWRRMLGGVLIAQVLGGVVFQVLIPNPCKGLTPSDFDYWMYSCWAQAPARTPFVIGVAR